MSNWTEPAKRRMEEFLRHSPLDWGLDDEAAVEMAEDLRRHIHEDLQRENVQTVTVDVLDRILIRFGPLHSISSEAELAASRPVAEPAPATKAEGKPPTPPEAIYSKLSTPLASRAGAVSAFVFFCICIPAFTLFFEWATGHCAAALFNPIPTFKHIALILASLAALCYLCPVMARNANSKQLRRAAFLTGFALVIILYYTILFLPIAPYAAVGIIAFGAGLLPLSPIFCAIGLSRAWRNIRLASMEAPDNLWRLRRLRRGGLFAGLVVLLAVELPSVLTRIGLQRAISDDGDTSRSGIAMLRNWGSEERLIAICYEMGRPAEPVSWLWSWGHAMGMGTAGRWRSSDASVTEKTRDIYYRVTGRPFSSVKPPRTAPRGAMSGFTWDADRGGDQVGVRLEGLDLEQSAIDAHLNAASGLGYQEWTMVFRNDSATEQEARCQVQLPPQGVVSRLTLWVNDQPEEAAFSSIAKVKAAYTDVVKVQQRDPVMVNVCGPDRVLVQCFPVPRRGGKMKIRFGITSPLVDGRLWLPQIIEQNFSLSSSLRHSLWLQADAPFSFPARHAQSTKVQGVEAIHSTLDPSELDLSQAFLLCAAPAAPVVWTEDRFDADPGGKFLVRTLTEQPASPPHRLIVVLDGSASLQPLTQTLAEILKSVNPVKIFLAGDEVQLIGANAIERSTFKGGCDNAPALLQAEEDALANPGSVIVWLHGPQPVELQSGLALRQRADKGRATAKIIDVPLAPGPNRISELLLRTNALQAGPRFADLAKELEPWFRTMSAPQKSQASAYERRAEAPPEGTGTKVWDQLARFWAREQVHQHPTGEAPAPEKTQLAATYQLVTPWSAAVVLETKAQYEKHGLKQADASTTPHIPAVPEPSTTALLLPALWFWTRRRRNLRVLGK